MKVAVVAANGRSGQAFVKAALDAGHSVRAGVYGSSHLAPNSRLTVVKCDATKEKDLANLLKGQNAVVSLIGHVKGSPPNVQTDAMKVLVKVMKKQGIKRIVSLTGTGVRFAGDKITLLDRFLNLGISIADPARVKDGQKHVEVLKGSGLEWAVIRVLKLQNVPAKPFALKENGPTKPYVGRHEVAAAILEVLEKGSFKQKAPIISKP